MQLALIVAAAENGTIGRNNALPWRLPADLAHFKRVTMGKPIIMGRKTYESIGRPLPGRANIVITRDCGFDAPGIHRVSSLSDAIGRARDIATIDGVAEAVIIGGAQIYAAALEVVQRIYLTRVHAEVEGDVSLPDIDWSQWRQTSCSRHEASPSDSHAYSFMQFERLVDPD